MVVDHHFPIILWKEHSKNELHELFSKYTDFNIQTQNPFSIITDIDNKLFIINYKDDK
jgi:hypothetical protein